jgi:ribosomal protein S18 acetylase RimI-like enzyme
VHVEIRHAQFPRDRVVVRQLFHEYSQHVGVNLSFQDFDAELASLPGKYAPPAGRLLLAWHGTNAMGCVALRPIDAISCEMKRIYVRPQARGQELGRRLAERICSEGRDAGYRRIFLDTLPTMESAMRLYQSMGFQTVDPYVFNPIPGAVFLALHL